MANISSQLGNLEVLNENGWSYSMRAIGLYQGLSIPLLFFCSIGEMSSLINTKFEE